MPRLAVLLLLLLAAVPGVGAQSDRVVVLPRAGEVLGPRADDMRQQFREVMSLYPPDLGRVLRLDRVSGGHRIHRQ